MGLSWRRYLLVALPLSALLVATMGAMLALPGFGDLEGGVDDLLPVVAARQQLFVRALVRSPEHEQQIVVLAVKGGDVLLPLFVTPSEGQAIADARDGKSDGRLLARAVGALGGSIEGVVLETSGQGELVASVMMQGQKGERSVRADSAEAIAAALRAGKPIWVTEGALSGSGVKAADLKALLAAAEKLREEEKARPSLSL